MRANYFLTFLAAYIYTNASSQIPTGYYSTAENKSDQELKNALHNIIDDHQEYYYSSTTDILRESDVDPNDQRNVILLYTGESVDAEDDYPGIWNKEHVWPQSRGDFGRTWGAGSDVHNLRACNGSINSSRSNFNFDFCYNSCDNLFGGSKKNEEIEIFEPRDEDKGDVARIIFYMDVRYEGDSGELDLEMTENYQYGNSPRHAVRSTLLVWHNQDPVDDFERNRNNVIYDYQGNRNPFIDHPELVNHLWGDKQNQQWNSSLSISLDLEDEVFIPNPVKTEYLNLESGINYTQIELIDMRGKVIRQLSGYVNRIQMPTSTGIYFLNLKYDNKLILKKLIISSI